MHDKLNDLLDSRPNLLREIESVVIRTRLLADWRQYLMGIASSGIDDHACPPRWAGNAILK